MPRNKPPRIRVVAAEGGKRLRIAWADGKSDAVALEALIRHRKALAPLARSAAFARARVGAQGWTVAWPGGIELDATFLFRLARIQAGDSLSPEDFIAWRRRHGYSQGAAAEALGLSDRMVKYYEQGRHAVPRTVLLACKGLDAMSRRRAA